MRKQGGRRAVARAAAMCLVAGTVVMTSSPAHADAVACTFDAQSVTLSGVDAGDVVVVSCSGLANGQTVVVNEESPLAAVVVPASAAANEVSGSPVLGFADASGVVDTTFTIPSPFAGADPAAACPPTQVQVDAGLANCVLTVRDDVGTVLATARLVYNGQPSPQATPTVSVTNGASFVAGDIVTLTGSDFWGNASGLAPTVRFGSTVATPLPASPASLSASIYLCDVDCNGTAGTLVPGGVLSGSVVVPAGLNPGTAALSVAQPNATLFEGGGPSSAVVATTQVLVLGPADATASPDSGGTGTPVQVTGTGWDPQGPSPVLAFLSPSEPGGAVSTGTAVVDGNGNMAGVITVGSSELRGPNPIVVTQGGVSAQASFTVTDVTSQCQGTACTTNQVLTQLIGVGDLRVSQQSSSVMLSSIVLNGSVQHSTGVINAIDVVDDRGVLVGWSVTGTLGGDFVNQAPGGGAANNTIPAGNLTWTPSVSLLTEGSGDLAQVRAGAPAPLSKTTGSTLCAAATGGGGGAYRCTALLDLTIPASVAAGTYTVVLNITIT